MTIEKVKTAPKADHSATHKIIVVIPAYNEEAKIRRVVEKIPKNQVDEILVIDDGSTDGSCEKLHLIGAQVIRHQIRQGIGVAIRNGLKYALEKRFEIIVVMAGNDKDDSSEIPRLIDPILQDQADYVQGSRYLKGGNYGQMPKHRFLFTKLYSLALRLATFTRVTDGTNGFRAYRSDILRDTRIDIFQDWLIESMEYYLSIKILQLKYRYCEVPVTKLYPRGVGYRSYTKVKPFSGWIKRLKPLLFLTFRVKR